jgi:hypothetical protein
MQHKRKMLLVVSILLVMLVGLSVGTAVQAQSENIALGADPTESDPGWGGGIYPWDMVDGLTYYPEWWHGLAFTGGWGSWNNEPCGWRQATINWGSMQPFNRVMIWHHGVQHIPITFNLLYWNGSSWQNVGGSYSVRYDLEVPPSGVPGANAIPTEHIFPRVVGSKVRLEVNNCNIEHGWIYEFEVFRYNQPPVCSAAYPSVEALWPAQHQMVPVSVQGVTDPDGDPVTLSITHIRQDEPVNGLGDGDTAPDGWGIGAAAAELRAERAGTGNGRVYHIGFSASDPWGGACSGTVRVRVDHSQGKKGMAVDDGPMYDSTGS